MDKFIIIGDNTNKIGNVVSLSNVVCVRYVGLKEVDIIYNDTDDGTNPKLVRITLAVNAVNAHTYYNYVAEKVAEAWQKSWTDPSPVTIGGTRDALGAYSGTLPFLDAAGASAVIATVSHI